MISVKTLTQFDIFADLEKDFLEEIASVSEEITVKKGMWLFHEGDSATSLYMIVSGEVELKLSMDKNRNLHVTLNTMSKNDAFGWSSMIDPCIYRLGAVASETTKLIKVNGEQLRTLLAQYPDNESIVMRRITNAVGSRLAEMSEKTPELSFRLTTSIVLGGMGLLTGILIAIYAVFATVAEIDSFNNVVGSTLFCAIVPIGFFIFAYLIAPSHHTVFDNTELPLGSDTRQKQVEQQA